MTDINNGVFQPVLEKWNLSTARPTFTTSHFATMSVTTTTTTLSSETALEIPNFYSIPILDFTESQKKSTKPGFLARLRNALVVVGFFYLKNPPVPRDVIHNYIEQSKALCNLPLEKKQKIAMIHSKHFLGYSSVGSERTSQIIDQREIFDVSSRASL
jgi:hypothetical protein